jgi:hypothetical protein
MDYVMVIRPSDIFGAIFWGFIILVSIWIWIDVALYKRHMAKQGAKKSKAQKEGDE